nr:hypothetical protein [Afipia birgiae]
MPFIPAGFEGQQYRGYALWLEQLVEQSVYDELFDDGPRNLSVDAGRPVAFFVASLLDGLDAFVIRVDHAGARRAGGGGQRAGFFAITSDESAEQRGSSAETRAPRSWMTRNQKGLNGFECRLVDNRGNFIFDDFRLNLAFSVTLPRKFVEVPNARVGATREDLVNGASPEQ